VPNDARYQTVPHPVVTRNIIRRIHPVVNTFLKNISPKRKNMFAAQENNAKKEGISPSKNEILHIIRK
ncbi:hypothetical protein, partial [Mitsuokella multacida]|uniref:hypothetical protein n=2 Tax=Mitsuokella TaxID=52225 RepID=UPI003FED4917